MVLPEGFVLPPLPYLAVLLVGVLGVAAALAAVEPRVTDRTVLAAVPWMATGASGYVLYQQGAVPGLLEPLFGAPTVYVSTGVIAGAVLAAATVVREDPDPHVAVAGVVAATVLVGWSLTVATARGSLAPVWPLVALAAAFVATGATWVVLDRLDGAATAATGATGLVVVFGHALDAVSTAVGVDVLGATEKTPLSRAIMEAAGTLPTADVLGVGWLFVLVKLALAGVIVAAFTEYVREKPDVARTLLAGVAAVGLGPGAHNLLLFTVTAG